MKKFTVALCAVLILFQFAFAEEEYNGPTIEEIKEMEMDEPCGLTLEQLEKGLLYDLKPLASTYLDVENYVSVNAVLKAAQDALESNWGRDCFENNNISGFFTQNSFSSKEECIYFVGEKLHLWYLLEPETCKCGMEDCPVGIYYNGKTIYDISIKYCPSENGGKNYEYGDAVAEIAFQIYKRALSEPLEENDGN